LPAADIRRYLISVLFGLAMGYALVKSEIGSPGLNEFPLLALISRVTIVALVVSFFVGGQECADIQGRAS
jgi:hypothetical protein